jgi:6-phosphofructo-2-kinase
MRPTKSVPRVAVFDATNTTKARRDKVVRRCRAAAPELNVVFLESICTDERILEENLKTKARFSPDYRDMALDVALVDLRKRIKNYELVYETVEEHEGSFVKIINMQSQVLLNRIPPVAIVHEILAMLFCTHVIPRPIYLTRAGASAQYSVKVPAANDVATTAAELKHASSQAIKLAVASSAAHLTPAGKGFAQRLEAFVARKSAEFHAEQARRQANNNNSRAAAEDGESKTVSSSRWSKVAKQQQHQHDDDDDDDKEKAEVLCSVYSSTLIRALETAAPLGARAKKFEHLSSLGLLNTGICHGLSATQIQELLPEQHKRFAVNPYHYRFPGGESQADKARMLKTLVMLLELDRNPCVVVSHASTLKILYGFFLGVSVSPDAYCSLSVPKNVVIELRPNQYGWRETRYDLSGETPRVILGVNTTPVQLSPSGNYFMSTTTPSLTPVVSLHDDLSSKLASASVSTATAEAATSHGVDFYK